MFYIAAYKSIHTDDSVVPASYIAIVAIYLYVSFYSLGWSVAAWPAMSESVPNHVRSLTMVSFALLFATYTLLIPLQSIGLMSSWLFNFAISKLTPILLRDIKWGTFLLFGCTTMVAVVWTLLFYPETGGFAIEEIHTLFEGGVVKQSLKDNKYILSRKPRNRTVQEVSEEMNDDVESIASGKLNDEQRERSHV